MITRSSIINMVIYLSPKLKAKVNTILDVFGLSIPQATHLWLDQLMANQIPTWCTNYSHSDINLEPLLIPVDTTLYQRVNQIAIAYGLSMTDIGLSVFRQMATSNHFPLDIPVTPIQQAILDAETGHVTLIGHSPADFNKWIDNL